MTYAMLAAGAAFASFAFVMVCMSALVALTAGSAARRLDRYAARSRAAVLFRLRVLPAAVAGCCAFGIALPVFLWFEPRDTDEPVAQTLVMLAAVGAALFVRGAWRALRAWRATVRTSRAWRRRSRLVPGTGAPLPVYAMEGLFPTVAVVGIVRPVLFVAERVLAECSEDEVRAMIAHECAHVHARDNLKRFTLRSCPDLFRDGGALTRAWTAAAEEAADAHAAARHPRRALDLAQALIRVARLAPTTVPELASAFYLGGSIERRVRRLVQPAAEPDLRSPVSRGTLCLLGIAVALAVVLAAPGLHQLMETAVRILP